MSKLRIGAVPYLNAKPITAGLAERSDLEYVELVPSQLATALAAGDLDCALVSSIEAKRLVGSTILDAPCIASHGAVDSVRLFGAADPRGASRVALDGASRTSVALARLVYARFLARADIAYLDVGPAPDPRTTLADATLVIGDAALRIAALGRFESLDLGASWTEATGLPFVWAVWLAAPHVDESRRRELVRILSAARLDDPATERTAREWATRLGLPERVTVPYLMRTIRYELGDRERIGLDTFLHLAD